MGSFILFILWMVGLVVFSIELWGPNGVNGTCQLLPPSGGASGDTLAWLEQHSICESFFSCVVIVLSCILQARAG